MTTLENMYRYKMYCEDENKWITTIISSDKDDHTKPTSCPNSVSHVVKPASIKLIYTTYADEVIIDEDKIDVTGGNFMIETIKMDILKEDAIKDIMIEYPFNVTIFSIKFSIDGSNLADKIFVDVNPDTVIGFPVSAIDSGQSIININSNIMQILSVGYFISLSEGGIKEECGRIIDIDYVNETITVEKTISNSFTTSSLILLTVRRGDIEFTKAGNIDIATDFIGGSRLLKDHKIRVRYVNNNRSPNSLNFIVQYVY